MPQVDDPHKQRSMVTDEAKKPDDVPGCGKRAFNKGLQYSHDDGSSTVNFVWQSRNIFLEQVRRVRPGIEL